MALLETYSEIRAGFRQLWGDLNGGIVDLEIVCPGSWDSRNPPDSFRPEDVIGRIRVPLNEDLSIFSHSAEPIQIDAHRVKPAQINEFVDLCRNAGSLLPSTRKNELRLYCDWDSRKPEEIWIAHLLCLTEKYSQARLGIDSIRILKPIQFSIDVITDWMNAGLLPNEPPTAISSGSGPIHPTPVVGEVVIKPRERANSSGNEDKTSQLIATLVKHHDFDGSSVGNSEWIGCTELATAAGVVKSTASKFFKQQFQRERNNPDSGGWKAYKELCSRSPAELVLALQALTGELPLAGMFDRSNYDRLEAGDEHDE
jgi:hypothetical protein